MAKSSWLWICLRPPVPKKVSEVRVLVVEETDELLDDVVRGSGCRTLDAEASSAATRALGAEEALCCAASLRCSAVRKQHDLE